MSLEQKNKETLSLFVLGIRNVIAEVLNTFQASKSRCLVGSLRQMY